jgi:hypothetical protein
MTSPPAAPTQSAAQLPAQADDARDHRGEVLRHKPLVEELTALLYREDPIGIASWVPEDEYEGEAEVMAIWLPHAKRVDNARRRTAGRRSALAHHTASRHGRVHIQDHEICRLSRTPYTCRTVELVKN